MPTPLRTTNVLFRKPSTISQPSGTVEPVDLGGIGFAQSNWTSASATSSYILRGNACKTDVNGRKSWRQLLSWKGTPPDDDDECTSAIKEHKALLSHW